MALKLKPTTPPAAPFNWNSLPKPPNLPDNPSSLPSPTTSWLPALDMKLYGACPLNPDPNLAVIRCKECDKPVLKAAIGEHIDNCKTIRAGGAIKKGKGKADDASKKRKSSEPLSNDPNGPPKKRSKITKGRMKGPVDYDKQCGVINDKNLPCSRSLTCKSHSMGAKRSVLGRSKPYDELLLEWNRAHNPNFVEPVKRVSKAERKEKRDREKAEKKAKEREEMIAAGLDPDKKPLLSTKKSVKKTVVPTPAPLVVEEDWDVDSEEEVTEMVNAIKTVGIGIPLATPCDASSWFVERRERTRNCRHTLLSALVGGGGTRSNGTRQIV